MENQVPTGEVPQQLSVDVHQKELIEAVMQKQKEASKHNKLTRRLSNGFKKLVTPRSANASPRDAAVFSKGFNAEAAARDELLPSVAGPPSAVAEDDTIPARVTLAQETEAPIAEGTWEQQAQEEDEEETGSVAPILSPAPHAAKAGEQSEQTTVGLTINAEAQAVQALSDAMAARRSSGLLRSILGTAVVAVTLVAAAALGNAGLQRARKATRN